MDEESSPLYEIELQASFKLKLSTFRSNKDYCLFALQDWFHMDIGPFKQELEKFVSENVEKLNAMRIQPEPSPSDRQNIIMLRSNLFKSIAIRFWDINKAKAQLLIMIYVKLKLQN